MKINYRFALIVVCFVFHCSMANEEEMFIFKEYSGLKPAEEKWSCSNIEESTTYGVPHNHCSLNYINNNEGIRRMIILHIDIFTDGENAISGVKYLTAKSTNIRQDEFKNKKILSFNKTDEGFRGVLWQSDKLIVTIMSRKITIPDEFIADYLNKYPPTDTSVSSDSDKKKMIRDLMEKPFETIEKMERKRKGIVGTPSKQEQFHAMIPQCKSERWVRCQIGLTDADGWVDCPATKTMDDDQRSKEWDRLKKQAKTMDIVLENVNWTYIDKTQCNKDKDYDMELKLLEKLGLEPSDLVK